MSEKLDSFIFLNNHNVPYTKHWLKIAMYLFLIPGISKYVNARKYDTSKIQIEMSAAFAYAVMHFSKLVTDSRVSQWCLNNRSELVRWFIALWLWRSINCAIYSIPFPWYHLKIAAAEGHKLMKVNTVDDCSKAIYKNVCASPILVHNKILLSGL